MDRDQPYDLEDHAALAAEDAAPVAANDPLLAREDCPARECGARTGELHLPDCQIVWGSEDA